MAKFAILDASFEVVDDLDKYQSIIWTERVRENGEFELYTLADEVMLSKLKIGNYLLCDSFYNRETETASLMIIEDREIQSDAEDGDKLIITGRDLKSILDRRIVWKQTKIDKNTNVQTAIQTLIQDAITNPTDPKRKIPNFQFDPIGGNYPVIKEDIQYVGESIYECVEDICSQYKINYEVKVNFNDKKFHMKIVPQVNHGWAQTSVPPVIFSPKYNNLRNSSYKNISSVTKNVALIHGEGDECNMIKTNIGSDSYSGLERREMFVSASDLSQELEDGTIYSDATYTNMLISRGKKEMMKVNEEAEVYEGEADNTREYVYNRDYLIGDIVEIINEYGIESLVEVTEMVLSHSDGGETLVPTFEKYKPYEPD